MFDLILSYSSAINYTENNEISSSPTPLVIFMRDRYGNNCLHLVVIHHLQTMYSHIKETAFNILDKEIRYVYANKLLSEDIDKEVLLPPLPNTEGFKYGYCPQETFIKLPSDAPTTEAFNTWLNIQKKRKFEERMELVLNEDFHSPLTLCASSRVNNGTATDTYDHIKKREMIQFLITQMKKERWTYGPVKSSLLSLEGVEYPYYQKQYQQSYFHKKLPTEAGNKMFGVIEWLCITDSNLAAKIPEIQKIITAKWKRFGYYIFLKNFILRIILTCILTILLCLNNATPVYAYKANITVIDITISILYPIGLFLVACISMYELPCFLKLGFFEYWGLWTRRIRGAAKYEKISNTIIIFAFLCVVANEYIRYLRIVQGMYV